MSLNSSMLSGLMKSVAESNYKNSNNNMLITGNTMLLKIVTHGYI